MPLLQASSGLHYELIDLAEINLPFLDEPLKPALGNYQHEHTKAWSQLISSFDAFVFVFPQYNWGYPAPLKNALDFLYSEWANKSAGLVTYGSRGGGKGAAQLQDVLEGLHMLTIKHNVELSITDDDVDEVGKLLDLEKTLTPWQPTLIALDKQLVQALEQ
jgi:NAD(P)H-dependent FMN reductase